VTRLLARVVCRKHHGTMGVVVRQEPGGFPGYRSMPAPGPRLYPDTRDTLFVNLSEFTGESVDAWCRVCRQARPALTAELVAAVEGRRSKTVII
jgi:hypothetical protein